MMTRTYVVTGAASGIGKATAQVLRDGGHAVIGGDIADAEVIADLSAAEGRRTLVSRFRRRAGEGSMRSSPLPGWWRLRL